MLENGVLASAMASMTGADPARVTPLTAYNDPDLEIARIAYHRLAKQSDLMGRVHDAGYPRFLELWNEHVEGPYRERNESRLQQWRPDMTEDEIMLMMYQNQPVKVNPEVLGELWQLASDMDKAGKEADPNFSFFTHPQFKEKARFLNTEFGRGAVGLFVQGPPDFPWPVTASFMVQEQVGHMESLALNLANGLYELGRQSLAGMGAIEYTPPAPTNWVRDPNTGAIMTDNAKPFGIVKMIHAARALAFGEDVVDELADQGLYQLMDQQQRNDFENVTNSVASVASMFVGFAPAAVAMHAGGAAGKNLMKKGLIALGGNPKGKVGQFLSVAGEYSGAAVANGAVMTAAYGRMSDYGREFMHGAIMAPALLALGAMGKGAERYLKERKNMPQWLAKDVNQALQGAGFSAMELTQQAALWDMLKDANHDTFSAYLINMMGFVLGGRMFGRGIAEPTRTQRDSQRRIVAEELVTGERAVESLGDVSPREVELLQELGRSTVLGREALARGKRESAKRVHARRREVESELDVIAGGLEGKVEIEERKAGKPRDISKVRPKEALAQRTRPVEELRVATGVGGKRVPGEEGKVPKADIYGARPIGPESLRPPGATGQSLEGVPGTKPISPKELELLFTGKKPTPGIQILGRKFGGREGSEVQVDIKIGKSRRPGTVGLYKTMEGVIQMEQASDFIGMTHEWSHAMFRQVIAKGLPRETQLKVAEDWLYEVNRMMPEDIVAEAKTLLRNYPDVQKIFSDNIGEFAAETFAELFARELLSDARIETEAPGLTRWMRNFLAQPGKEKLAREFLEIREGLWRMATQGATKGIIASHGLAQEGGETFTDRQVRAREVEAKYGGLVGRIFRLYQRHTTDEFSRVRFEFDQAAMKAGVEPSEIPMHYNPIHMKEYQAGTAVQIANMWAGDRVTNLQGETVKGLKGLSTILREIKESDIPSEEFGAFLVSEVSIVRAQKGMPTVKPESHYLQAIVELRQKHPKIVKHANDVKALTDHMLDHLAETGAIPYGDAAYLKDYYAFYVPLIDAIEAPARKAPITAAGGLSAARGSTAQKKNVWDALTDQVLYTIRIGQEARTRRALVSLSKIGEFGDIVHGVSPSRIPKEFRVETVLDAIKRVKPEKDVTNLIDHMKQIEGLSDETILLFSGAAARPWGKGYIVPVKVNYPKWEIDYEKSRAARTGDDHLLRFMEESNNSYQYIETTKRMWDELITSPNWFDKGRIPVVYDYFFRPVNTVLKQTVVEANPIFAWWKNPLRDIRAKPVFSELGTSAGVGKYIPLSAMKDALNAIGDRDTMTRYENAGGLVATYRGAYSQKMVRRAIASPSKFRGNLRKVGELYNDYLKWNSRPETWLRREEFSGAYDRAIKEGKPKELALLEGLKAGKDLIVNYTKGGTVIKALNNYYPFLNARVQGWANTIKKAFETKSGMISAITNITIPALIIDYLLSDDEAYQSIPEYAKELYFHMPIPGTNQFIEVPRAFDLGYIFGYVPEVLFNLPGADREDAGIGKLVLNALMPEILQHGNWIPHAIQGAAETLVFDKDLFLDRDLTPQWMLSQEPAKRAYASTPQLFQWTFAVFEDLLVPLGVESPVELQHLADSYTGSYASHTLRAIENGGTFAAPQDILAPVLRERYQSSQFVNRVYEKYGYLHARRESLSIEDRAVYRRMKAARKSMAAIRRSQRSGQITRLEMNDKLDTIARKALGKE